LFLVPRDDPPGQTCSHAVQKLTEFTQNLSSGTVPLEFVSQTKDIHLKNIDLLQNLKQLEQKLNDCTNTNIANFEQLVICHHVHVTNSYYILPCHNSLLVKVIQSD
jgi:hypothetical protein